MNRAFPRTASMGFAFSLALAACGGGGGGGGAKTTPPPSVTALGISSKDIGSIAQQFASAGEVSDNSTSALTLALTLGVDCPVETGFDDDFDGEDDRFEYVYSDCEDPETGLILDGDGTIMTTEDEALILSSLSDSCFGEVTGLGLPDYGEAGVFDLMVTDSETGDVYTLDVDYQWGEFPATTTGLLDFEAEAGGFELENGTDVRVEVRACLRFDIAVEDLVPEGVINVEVENEIGGATIVEIEFVYTGENTIDLTVLDDDENVLASGTANLDTGAVTFD